MGEIMIYQGPSIQVIALADNVFEMRFDQQGSPINKFDAQTLEDLKAAVEALASQPTLAGVLITSAKDAFIVGADINMFSEVFSKTDAEIIEMNMAINGLFNTLEDLPCPTVVAINGMALGGGFEICLAADYRVMAEDAKVGLPEVKLGIFPGWGGSVRLPRLIGADNAIEWICSGSEKRAPKALFEGAVDAVVTGDKLREAALDLLAQCQAGKLDYLARRIEKQSPIKLGQLDAMMAFETAKGFIAGKAGPHYPAPVAAVKVMQKHAGMKRDKALEVEAQAFVKMAKTEVCANLVGLFLNDQQIKKVAAKHAKKALPVKQAAVLGAGIMGGGIAYQSAVKGTPILMKDINEAGIQSGLNEAGRLLTGELGRGRIDAAKMATALTRIRPALSYGDFKSVDLVVEAVVENPKVKGAVLAEVEQHVAAETILTSNTSTISITRLAESLQRPENFCGMHFFNPVHRMPLVEVIRGEKSSEQAIATTVAYALAMGKTPIVVNDCPGFLVNRILFPYFGGFSRLLEAGVELARIDKVMERFGWPMGPGYLLDVVGLDTAVHADKVMAEGFPDRMASERKSAIELLVEQGRLGQKSAKGFYNYVPDKKGKPAKQPAPEIQALLDSVVVAKREMTDEQIVAVMMVPLCLETVRCLEDGIVDSAAEADMGLVYGIGFPPFRGGALRYIDTLGLEEFCQLADQFSELGTLFKPTEKLRAMAAAKQRFYA
ncbi:MAG: 3-hydroxyacyl-CoA dehydrogenase/enoyl-CoA hydratase/3-hydroxybutyryl-CoA epimerase [Motiliproteus sp.]|jgi:3-hydroxyacyl-CoA dehydrogenase/enoyl-CoA hydratase/3-hydroxybutyryl-CoA epimerase/enoyl-CoA isomerase